MSELGELMWSRLVVEESFPKLSRHQKRHLALAARWRRRPSPVHLHIKDSYVAILHHRIQLCSSADGRCYIQIELFQCKLRCQEHKALDLFRFELFLLTLHCRRGNDRHLLNFIWPALVDRDVWLLALCYTV